MKPVTLTVALALMLSGCRKGPSPEAAHPIPADYAARIEQWRAKHEADYREDYVTIAGLFPLKEGDNTAGSAATNDIRLAGSVPASIGKFVLTGGDVRYEPARGVDVRRADEPVKAPVILSDDSSSDADELLVGDVRMVIHKSGGKPSLRVRDPNGPLAKGFLGFQWFPIDPRYRVVGRFIRDAEPKSIPVANTYGDLDTYKSEGVIEFTLMGETLRLRPFTTRPKRFYIVFRDGSSGQETYEAARFLYADLLDDGMTVLDFNQAYNPPCAFNPYTTCPLPPKVNRLPLAVEAGEKRYAGPKLTPERGNR